MHIINKLSELYPMRRLQQNTAPSCRPSCKHGGRIKRRMGQYLAPWLMLASLLYGSGAYSIPCDSHDVDNLSPDTSVCQCFEPAPNFNFIAAQGNTNSNEIDDTFVFAPFTDGVALCDNLGQNCIPLDPLPVPAPALPADGIVVFQNLDEMPPAAPDFFACDWQQGVGFSNAREFIPPEPPIAPFPATIPTISTWGLVVLIGLLGAAVPFANRIRHRKQKLNG